MKVAAVVILFHPTIETVSNIKSYYDFADKIFVFDNTEIVCLIKDELETLQKVQFYHDGKNEGIARRLNQALEMAIVEQYEWILTMDQDSSFSDIAISRYFNCFKQYKNKEEVAAFGTDYGRRKIAASDACKAEEVQRLITSAMLVNLSLYEKIGKFDEALFIDSVDSDYCFRALFAGYAVIRFLNVSIFHEMGTEVYKSSIKSLFLLKKRKVIHSPLRCYYMYRNLLYLESKYKFQRSPLLKELRGNVQGQINACIFYGRNFFEILKYLRLARKDFKTNQMGKIGR